MLTGLWRFVIFLQMALSFLKKWWKYSWLKRRKSCKGRETDRDTTCWEDNRQRHLHNSAIRSHCVEITKTFSTLTTISSSVKLGTNVKLMEWTRKRQPLGWDKMNENYFYPLLQLLTLVLSSRETKGHLLWCLRQIGNKPDKSFNCFQWKYIILWRKC